ncbi:DUF397 domain-containing protein [Streptomyces scopuliridis]|uniref:DUF397 domain-containing protein n=1 Tax=Streptomyces scopuliridis TaxID=452529 RepID=UPI0036CD22A5
MNDGIWQRASACGSGGNNCVEAASATDLIAFRDSTRPDRTIVMGRGSFSMLLDDLKAGRFAPPQV